MHPFVLGADVGGVVGRNRCWCCAENNKSKWKEYIIQYFNYILNFAFFIYTARKYTFELFMLLCIHKRIWNLYIFAPTESKTKLNERERKEKQKKINVEKPFTSSRYRLEINSKVWLAEHAMISLLRWALDAMLCSAVRFAHMHVLMFMANFSMEDWTFSEMLKGNKRKFGRIMTIYIVV